MNSKRVLRRAIPLTLLFLLSGCAGGTLLSTQSLVDLEPGPGTYNLILFGGQNARDLRSIAILDRTDDPYTILPYGAAFNYRLIEKLTASEAMERGGQFINDLYAYRATERREIHGPDQTVIGYELRPLFMPLTTGRLGDLLDTSYLLQPDNRVLVYVGFKEGYHDPLEFPGPGSPWGGR